MASMPMLPPVFGEVTDVNLGNSGKRSVFHLHTVHLILTHLHFIEHHGFFSSVSRPDSRCLRHFSEYVGILVA